MYKKSTSSFLATSLMLSLTTASMPAVAAVVNADWINGSGNYSDVTNGTYVLFHVIQVPLHLM